MNPDARAATSSGVWPISGLIAMVTIRSTRWPATRVPATAFVSATVRLTARRSGPFGSNSCPGSRIEKVCPSVVDARTLRVMSWPVATGTPTTRPRTWSSDANAVSLDGSAGIERTLTSPSSIALRDGISRVATTTSRMSTAASAVRRLACSARKTVAATRSAMMMPTAM